MNNMNTEKAFLTGFIKAANAAGIPPIGAPANPQPQTPAGPAGPQPQAPQPNQAQLPSDPAAMGGGGQPHNQQLFYQLLAQIKQQNPMPQVPAPIQNIHNSPIVPK